MPRILIIEDEATVARVHHRALSEDGHAVDVADSVARADALLARSPYDAIVLDVVLGPHDGIRALADWRRTGIDTPVLVCSGRDATADVVLGLDAGADEYVSKPVTSAELRARVRALLRRSVRRREIVTVANVRSDRLARRVEVDGRQVALAVREHMLLDYLLLNPARTLTRPELLEQVWGMRFDPKTNVVDVCVARVRRKLRDAGAHVSIEPVRLVGYVVRTTHEPVPA